MRLIAFTTLIIQILFNLCCAYKTVSDDTLRGFPDPGTDFEIKDGAILSPILIPRVPGTPGSLKVLQHFVNFFNTSLPEWKIEFQNSTSKTPLSGDNEVPFSNFIARREPPWAAPGQVGYLTLVAHYDSLIKPEGFIGAIDSAAPCAMIMHAVRSIDAALTKKWNDMQASGVDVDLDDDHARGIQVFFLDGEEAFKSWSSTDSLYGARSMAEEWDKAMYPATSTYKTRLNSIELFVLLDLLGSAENTPIPSWMQNTHWSYQHMAELEGRLRSLNLFKSDAQRVWLNEKDKPNDGVFRSYDMQDDHVPFVARGVQTLHLIPSKFPSVWHTIKDDGEHLDIPTVKDWALLTTAFAAEYLELEGYFQAPKQLERRSEVISKTEL